MAEIKTADAQPSSGEVVTVLVTGCLTGSDRSAPKAQLSLPELSLGIVPGMGGNINGLVKRRKLTPEKADNALSLFRGVLDYNGFNDVDMVIEAVIENISLKQFFQPCTHGWLAMALLWQSLGAFFPYIVGAHVLVHLVVDPFQIDKAITDFGIPIGPFQLQDVVGYRVNMAAGNELVTVFSDRSFRSPLVTA